MPDITIPKTMKAMTLIAYDHLELAEVPVPRPGPGEVLCRIKSVAICGSDPKMIHGHYAFANWPPYYPFIMGHEWSGQVVELGEGVTDFKVGDRVAGEAHVGCGKCDNCKRGHYTVCLNYGRDGHDGGMDVGHRHYGFYWQGANAEYNVYKTSGLHRIPDGVSYDVASMCDCAGVAMHGVELAGVTPGGTSVIIGPGAIGLCAMMECKAMGSGQVIVVGRGAKLKKAEELGADVCIDFEKEDPVQRVLELTGGVGADEVMECSGASDSPMKACKMVRKTGAVALIATYKTPDLPLPLNTINFNEIRIIGAKANPNVSDKVLKFFANGAIQGEKLITHTFPLEEYEKAVDIFEHKKDGSIKVVINP
ncbi:MAG: zinc-binding dehydrogenase [Oscillospiraceae bacterium]